MINNRWILSIGAAAMITITASPLHAQTILPGPAEIDRLTPIPDRVLNQREDRGFAIPERPDTADVPQSFKEMTLTLDEIDVKGVTVFSEEQLKAIYASYLNREITLDKVWLIADEITQLYREAGYFLSRAYVPAQEIENNYVTISVVEGFVADVEMEGALAEKSIIRSMVADLTLSSPVSAAQLESFMLRMNDLPGVDFRAVIQPKPEAGSGAAKLLLRPQDEEDTIRVEFDNAGSRFLGPYRTSLLYQGSVAPLQQTTFSALSSLPADELKYAALDHTVPIAPDWELGGFISYVASEPGAGLAVNEIESSSAQFKLHAAYQAIRQRQENLSFRIELDAKNTDSDILGNTTLTRDRIRALRLGLDYDASDDWNGYNYLFLELSRGVDLLGSSNAGDLNLSRAEATPDFTTLNLSYTRFQSVAPDWLMVGQISGQIASDPLFSSEEFGYGGQQIGRAYDASELVGDHGLAGSLEIRYTGIDPQRDISIVPYGFYDIGRVWNEDIGSKTESASSAGVGVRLAHDSGLSMNLGLAFPLVKSIDTPIYGDDDNPRVLISLGYLF